MSVKLVYLCCIAAVLFGLSGSALAADNHWLGTARDNEWGNVDNWEGGHVPDAVLWPTEEAEVGYTTVGAGPILGPGDVGSAYRIFLGQNDGDTMYGELTMDGGTITTSGYMSTAYHEGTSALITVNSGSVYIGEPNGSNGHLYLGRAGSAILNINGGSFTADDNIELGKNATGYGEINLAGGTLQAGTLKLGAGAGLVNITGGKLVLVGDDTVDVDGFIATGLIVANGGAGTLEVVFENDLTTVTAVSEKPPLPPLEIKIFEQRIVNDADDAEERLAPERGNVLDVGSSDLELAYEDESQGDPQVVGLRFTDIAIPSGSQIVSAWVRFQVDETRGGTEPVNLVIKGELSPNPASFLVDAFNMTSRPTTAASVKWSVPDWITADESGPDQTSADIASIIQEIVDQPDWAGGNAVVIMFSDDPSNPSLGVRCAVAGPGNDSAMLHIEYGVPATNGYVLAGEKITATASSSFSAEEGPENTINGSGLDVEGLHSFYPTDMWTSEVVAPGEPTWIQYEFDKPYSLDEMLVWNHNSMAEDLVGFGIKEAIVEYSLDGTTWTTLGETQEFARADGVDGYASDTTIDFGGVIAKSVRITANSNWGNLIDQYGLSEVRFMYIPIRAYNPEPASETTDQDPLLALSWLPGGRAVSHNLYLATDQQSVIDGTAPLTNLTQAASDLLSLDLSETYYWRVDEVGGPDDPGVWVGDVWSFSTSKQLAVDDFEDYTDNEGNRIYETWVDGFTNNTSSLVGHENAPFAEQTIVHGGRQSMPLAYDNAGSPWYSEVERTWDAPQNWTAHTADTLKLYFQSDPNIAPAQLYVAVQDSDGNLKVVTHPDGEAAVGLDRWQGWTIPLSEFSDAGINMASVKTLYIGLGDRINPAAGGAGTIYIDDVTLSRSATVSVAEYALDFDGVDDYVETPISNVPMNGTVEAWIRTTSQNREAVISSYGGDQEFRVHLNYRPGKSGSTPGVLGLNVRFRTLTGYVEIGEEMYDGSWHHVAFVWEGESPGTIRAYWDGQEKAITYREQNEWAGNYNRSSVHVIGREDLNNSSYFFAGMIDEVRFWEDRARTESEIQEYMGKELLGSEEGLMGYWKFNEASGTTAYDSSPNGNHCAVSGAVSTTETAPVAP